MATSQYWLELYMVANSFVLTVTLYSGHFSSSFLLARVWYSAHFIFYLLGTLYSGHFAFSLLAYRLTQCPFHLEVATKKISKIGNTVHIYKMPTPDNNISISTKFLVCSPPPKKIVILALNVCSQLCVLGKTLWHPQGRKMSGPLTSPHLTLNRKNVWSRHISNSHSLVVQPVA